MKQITQLFLCIISALMLALFILTPLSGSPADHINDALLFTSATPGIQGWGDSRGLSLTRTPDALQLSISAFDSSISCSGLNLNPGMFEWLHVRYRATGFMVAETSGELFYTNTLHQYDNEHYVYLPSLELDSQWHDLWVNIPRNLKCDAWDWWDGGPVSAVRLDLANQAPGMIEIATIKLCAQRAPRLIPVQGTLLTDWTDANGLLIKPAVEQTRLEILNPDSRFNAHNISLDPATARYIYIRYRAWGFNNKNTTGQIFYANNHHGIIESAHIKLPSLQTDGRWHEMVLDVWQILNRDTTDWLFGGPITTLRFDLVDQTPGKIDIGTIFFSPRLNIASLNEIDLQQPAGVSLLTKAAFTPSATNRSQCQIKLPEKQHTLWVRVIDIPAAFKQLEGLTLQGSEYVTPVCTNTGQHRWVAIGHTKGDIVTIALATPPGGLLDAFLITPGDAKPKDAPVIALEQISSAVKPLTRITQTQYKVYWTGSMLACPQEPRHDAVTGNTTSYFRRNFIVPEDLASAWLQISVDDYFRLYLNGEKIAENLAKDSWKKPTLLNLTNRLRRGQTNCLAIEAINSSRAEGVLVDLVLNRADHSYEKIVSDAKWRCLGQAPDGWHSLEFDDSKWVSPTLQPGPPNAPWTVEIPFADKTWQPVTRLLGYEYKSVIQAGENQDIILQLDSAEPVSPGNEIVVTLNDKHSRNCLKQQKFTLTKDNCQQKTDGSITVTGLTISLSPWLPTTSIAMTVSLPHRILRGPAPRTVTFEYENHQPPATLRSEVQVINGMPRLLVNGKPFFAMVGNGEGRERQGTAAAYRKAGFNVSAIWIDPLETPQWWLGPDKYDFNPVDKHLRASLEVNPEILILPIIWAAPPSWWQKLYPEERALFSDGTPWDYYRSTPSFNSHRWREDAARALTAFVKHIENAPYAAHVLGYWVIGGVSAEWQGWGCHASAYYNHLMDYSAPEQKAFAEYLRKHYPTLAASAGENPVPEFTSRLDAELGVFRDPAKASLCTAYNQFYSDSVADCMLSCISAVKQAVGRSKIVGTYYGYSLEYTNMDWALQISGHNAVRKVLDSPDIDFLSAPHSYAVRAPGEDMGWMWASASINHAGKLFWPDDDSRTYLSGPCDYTPTINPAQTRETLRRNFGKELCHLNPVGFLQIESGHELGSSAIARDCQITRRAGEIALENHVRRRAQIAVVVDEESIRYLAQDTAKQTSGQLIRTLAWNGDMYFSHRPVNNLAAELIGFQRERIAKIGAPVDIILYSDLKRHELDYKLYIMLSCFQYDEEMLTAVQRQIHHKDATVLWCYAPGFIKGMSADVQNMQALTGFDFRQVQYPGEPVINITDLTSPITKGLSATTFGPEYSLNPRFAVEDADARALGVYRDTGEVALAYKKVGKSHSYFCGSTILPPDLLRNIARVAGVHVYLESGDALDANDSFIMLHTTTAGVKTIYLPQKADVVDLYANKLLFTDVSEFKVDEAAETTRVFCIGNAARWLTATNE